MRLFSGTSNLPLAKSVASLLHMKLGDAEITRFIDNECRVYIRENVEGQDVYVLQSLSEVADQHLVELCLVGQAIKGLGAKKVTAVIPWMGYSKQDKAFRKGEAISAQLVARFIESAGFDAVIAAELHSKSVLPYFSVPVTEISTHSLLGNAAPTKRVLEGCFENTVVASPDKGGRLRSEQFAHEVKLDIAYLKKVRDVVTGNVTVTGTDTDIAGKTVIIFDDIINTAATAIQTSAYVKKQGAQVVLFLATHAVFAGNAVKALAQSVIDRVVVTDTIVIPKEKQFEKLSIVSIAPLLAEVLSHSV